MFKPYIFRKYLRFLWGYKRLVFNYLPIINYLLPDKIFCLFKFSSLFQYKEYLFYFYINKLYLSFNRILTNSNFVVINSLLSRELFVSRFSLDFLKLLDLTYNVFSNLISVHRTKKIFPNCTTLYFADHITLRVSFGYVRYR